MRKIAATYIFPVNQPPIKNGILTCENNGTITEIIDTGGKISEISGLEYYSGIIVPGFVNTHCHLELSHLHQKIPEKQGIVHFIDQINRPRNISSDTSEAAMRKADRRMWADGIAVVGDIANSLQSLDIKKKSKIFYHTFVETSDFLLPADATKNFEKARIMQHKFRENGLSASIVPHSAYSVSELLFKIISEYTKAEESILSIHNQESEAEIQFFKDDSEAIENHLQEILKIDTSHCKPSGESPLEAMLIYLPQKNPLLLVHNTFMKKVNADFLKQKRKLENTWLVLCPNSNLYIENLLPPVGLFREKHFNICIGTDSLASNHRLSVLDEMTTLQLNFPELNLQELLNWACLNGARALAVDDKYGSLEPGKKPGINLISGIDFQHLKLTKTSRVKQLL